MKTQGEWRAGVLGAILCHGMLQKVKNSPNATVQLVTQFGLNVRNITSLLEGHFFERATELALMLTDEIAQRPELNESGTRKQSVSDGSEPDLTTDIFAAGLDALAHRLASRAPQMVDQIHIYQKGMDHAIRDGNVARAREIMFMTVEELKAHGHPEIESLVQTAP